MKNVRNLAVTVAILGLICLGLGAGSAAAQTTQPPMERLCDPAFEDCREIILNYIRQETVQIDMGFWLMTDARYANELVRARERGVTIRLLMDPRCSGSHGPCATQNEQLKNAGIPMRNRITSGILHWKMVIFRHQNQVQFAGANYAPFEMTPEIPFVNYTDEIVYFSKDPSIVNSFMTKFDDLWISTTEFADWANVTEPLVRSYPVSPIDPQLNFPPDDSYRARALAAYAQEQQQIDVLMFRVTDENHTNAMIQAINRNVPVRLITDETEYRNQARLWHSYNIDKMWYAGVQVRVDGHQGINHEKAIVLRGTSMSIFGSSNWTSPSSDSQREHNMFTTQQWIYDWIEAQFDRKWGNTTGHQETKPFVPLPPDVPAYQLPANAGTGVQTTGARLVFHAGLWAHLYDIYFGTSPNPPLLETEIRLGPSQHATDYRYYNLPQLVPGTRYYWKIVSKTMARKTAEGPVWSFTTAGVAPNNLPPSVSITSPAGGASFTAPATITVAANATDSDGTIVKVDFYQGNTLIGTDASAPFSVSWTSVPAGSYSLTAVATDSGNATATSAAVSMTVANGGSSLPGGWSAGDIGNTGVTGASTFSNGTYTVAGGGADVWGTADALHYAYTTLTGDGSIVARVTSIQNVHAWTKAGVMIRNSTAAGSAQAFMLVAASAAKGVPFQRRLSDGNSSVSTSGSQNTAPRWVKLVRAGNSITGYESPDGVNWIVVGVDNFTLNATVLIGLGVSSHITGVNATATFDNVTVTPVNTPANNPPSVSIASPATGATFTAPATIAIAASASDSDGSIAKVEFFAGGALLGSDTTAPYQFNWGGVAAGTYSLTAVATDNSGVETTSAAVSVTVASEPPPQLPAGWSNGDVGNTGAAGAATFAGGTFSVSGAGADVWGTADQFHYAYRTLNGNGTIIARVSSIQYVNAWTKAGVMIRSSLSPSASQAFMLVAASASKGVPFQRRTSDGNISTSSPGSQSTAPRWVKLVRAGNVISGYESADGVNWTLVGSDTFAMGQSVFIGLAVSSHVTGVNATATFDNVSIQ